MAKALFGKIPIQAGYFYNRKAEKEIHRLINTYKPDHIYCQFIRTTEYVKNLSIKKTLDYQDVLSYGIKRRLKNTSKIKKPFLIWNTRDLLTMRGKYLIISTTKQLFPYLIKILFRIRTKKEIHVIPNGVDYSYF